VEAAEVVIGVGVEGRVVGYELVGDVVDVEAVVPEGDPGGCQAVPDVGVGLGPVGGDGGVTALRRVGGVAAGVVGRPQGLREGVGGAGHRPVPPLGADLGVGVEVVQGDEAALQGAGVRGR